MADDQPTLAKPEAWFGVIQGAAREHATTAETWDRIHAYAQDNNLAIPSDMFSEVNRMRGLASGLTYASERLTAANEGDAITSSMIGQQIYARPAADLQAIAELYHVRFEMTTMTALGPETGWYNMDYGNQLPATVDELRADLEDYGQGLSDAYGQEYGSIGRIEIGAW